MSSKKELNLSEKVAAKGLWWGGLAVAGLGLISLNPGALIVGGGSAYVGKRWQS